jgi:hypothetical protein
MPTSSTDDNHRAPADPLAPSFGLEAAIQDHPIAALLAAMLIGLVLAKTIF